MTKCLLEGLAIGPFIRLRLRITVSTTWRKGLPKGFPGPLGRGMRGHPAPWCFFVLSLATSVDPSVRRKRDDAVTQGKRQIKAGRFSSLEHRQMETSETAPTVQFENNVVDTRLLDTTDLSSDALGES